MNDAKSRPVALVTGAASGIGRELARRLHLDGHAVALLDRNAAGLQALEREVQTCVACAVADVTDRAALQKAVAGLEATLGGVDLLIASAGIGRESSGIHFNSSDFQAIVDVNLIGVANTIDAVLPGMVKRRRGHVVALSSLASYHGLPLMAGYCASKAGLNALLDSLRVELKPLGIHCTTVCAGWTNTAMTANLLLPPRDLMEVEVVAERIMRAIRRRQGFVAFPWRQARRVRLLSWLPARWGDRLVARFLKTMKRG